MSDLSGKTLGQYQIIRSIGQGGMAKIYLAYQTSIRREVAIKVMSSPLQQSNNSIKRFTKEVEVIAHLQHPQIIPVYDFGEHDDQIYIVMAYIRAGTLADRIDHAPNGLSDREIIRLFDLICEGLDYAHAKGVVHRDLKPNNILMDENNNPYIADFGLAKLTEGKIELTHTMMTGTAAYMAPEIAQSGKSTKRADIYALGIILFEMLTGKLPFQGETPYKMLSAHIHQPVPNIHKFKPDLPEALQSVIDKVLAKDPVNRFATPRELTNPFILLSISPRPCHLQRALRSGLMAASETAIARLWTWTAVKFASQSKTVSFHITLFTLRQMNPVAWIMTCGGKYARACTASQFSLSRNGKPCWIKSARENMMRHPRGLRSQRTVGKLMNSLLD